MATLLVIQLVSTQRGSGSSPVKYFSMHTIATVNSVLNCFLNKRDKKLHSDGQKKTTTRGKDILFINIWLSFQLPPSVQLPKFV
jgi:hypothetical protein